MNLGFRKMALVDINGSCHREPPMVRRTVARHDEGRAPDPGRR